MKKIIQFGSALLIVLFIVAGYTGVWTEKPDKTLLTAKAEKADVKPKKNLQPGLINIPNAYNVTGKSIKSDEPAKNSSDKPKENSADKTVLNNGSIRGLDPKKPMVALTFDDGPHPRYTSEILETLKENNEVATFFVLGSRAEEYQNVIKNITANGNQLGNHTYDHKQLTKLNKLDIESEINKTSAILKNITGAAPSLTRPTYGSVNDNVRMYAGSPLILWSVDTLDWKTRNTNKIVKQALAKVKDGDIILMHDIYKTTSEAVKIIAKELKSRGYQTVTINELYEARGVSLSDGKEYFKCPSTVKKDNK